MAAEKLLIDKIEHRYGGKPFIDRRDIASLYRVKEEEISPTTFNRRIHALFRSGVLQRIGRGRYSLGRGNS